MAPYAPPPLELSAEVEETAEGSPRAERQKGKLRQSQQGAGPSNATHLAQTSR